MQLAPVSPSALLEGHLVSARDGRRAPLMSALRWSQLGATIARSAVSPASHAATFSSRVDADTAEHAPPSRHPPRGRNRPTLFALAAAGLVVATVVTRLPFMTSTLYAFDSANYALAVRDFYNVAFHQPHPPGYPLYVLFARAIDLLVHDASEED